MKPRVLRLAVLTFVSVLALSGCGGDDKDKAAADKEKTEATEEPTEEDGVTKPGTELALGAPANVSWEPKTNLTAEVAISVNRLDQTTMKDFAGFQLNPAVKASTPYYVQIAVENLGESDLSGVGLPVYLDNGSDVLIPAAAINSAFKPCPSRPLPAKFVKGQKANLCLVFLAPQGTSLKVIALRPSEAQEPITWTGAITNPVPPKKPAKKG